MQTARPALAQIGRAQWAIMRQVARLMWADAQPAEAERCVEVGDKGGECCAEGVCGFVHQHRAALLQLYGDRF